MFCKIKVSYFCPFGSGQATWAWKLPKQESDAIIVTILEPLRYCMNKKPIRNKSQVRKSYESRRIVVHKLDYIAALRTVREYRLIDKSFLTLINLALAWAWEKVYYWDCELQHILNIKNVPREKIISHPSFIGTTMTSYD